jgi:hypothetical protein
MKNLFIVFLLFVFYTAKSQDGEISNIDIETPLDRYIDWGDPLYSLFFTALNSSGDFTIFPGFKRYDQADPSWGNNPIANNCSSCITNAGNPYGVIVNGAATTRCALRSIGCLLTCESMILSTWGYNQTPSSWNDYLKRPDVNGFSGCLLKPNNMYLYTTDPSSAYISLQFSVNYLSSNDDVKTAKILKAVIDQLLGLTIVKLNKIGRSDGTIADAPSGHFVVVYGYKTTNPTLKDFIIADPGTVYDDLHLYRTLGDYYKDGVSPLFISTPGIPSIRFFRHGMYSYNIDASINFPQPSYETGQTMNLSLPSTSTKSALITTTSKQVVWTIEGPEGEYSYSTENTFNFLFYKPGDYCIKLAVKDGDAIYSDIKTITVTGKCIPRSCSGHNISNIAITGRGNKVDFDFDYGVGYIDFSNYCSAWCDVPAMWLKKQDYSQQQWSMVSGTGGTVHHEGYHFGFSNLEPNSNYVLKSSDEGYDCTLFVCGFDNDKFFNDCYWEILTSPNTISRNTDITSLGTIEDNAFSSVTLNPGFVYETSNGKSYTAQIVTGHQVQRYCGNGDNNLKSAVINDNNAENCNIVTNIEKKNNVLIKEVKDLSIEIVPNPSNGMFRLSINFLGSGEKVSIRITNLSGAIVINKIFVDPENILDLSNQAKGLYIITIQHKKDIYKDKIIIQ